MYNPGKEQIEMWQQSADGKVRLAYFEKFNREPLGLDLGAPDMSEYNHDPIKVMEVCIDKGITWERLLNYERLDDVLY